MTTSNTKLKKIARARQAETRERYTTALAWARTQQPEVAVSEEISGESLILFPLMLLKEGVNSPVLVLRPGESFELRGADRSGRCTARGLTVMTLANGWGDLRIRELRIGDSGDLLPITADPDGPWVDASRFSSSARRTDEGCLVELREVRAASPDDSIRLMVMNAGASQVFASISLLLEGDVGDQPERHPSWKLQEQTINDLELLPMLVDADPLAGKLIAVSGGDGAVGARIAVKMTSFSEGAGGPFRKIQGILVQEEDSAEGMVLCVENFEIWRNGRLRIGSLIGDGLQLGYDYRKIKHGPHLTVHPIIGPGDEVRVDLAAFSPSQLFGTDRATIRTRISVVTTNDFSQRDLSAWVDEVREFDSREG